MKKNFRKISLVAGFVTLVCFGANAQNSFPAVGNLQVYGWNNLNFGTNTQNRSQQFIYGDETVQTLIFGAGGQNMLQLSNGTTLGKNLTLLNNAQFNAHTINVGKSISIGTIQNTNPAYSLTVNGGIACKSVKVYIPNNDGTWPDYVFKKEYKLAPLSEVETFIAANSHLPNVPSEAEVKGNGIDMAEMDAVLLRKIEELTLYMIQLKKENEELSKKVEALSDKE